MTIYNVIVKLVKLKQLTPSAFPSFVKEYRELVHELMTFGTTGQILAALLSTMFILSVDQTYFKDVLSGIYDAWPELNPIVEQMTNFFTNTETMKVMLGDDKKEGAYAVEEDTEVCWNCGRRGHQTFDCRAAKHMCTDCGRTGHLERFCAIVTDIIRRKRNESTAEARESIA